VLSCSYLMEYRYALVDHVNNNAEQGDFYVDQEQGHRLSASYYVELTVLLLSEIFRELLTIFTLHYNNVIENFLYS